MENFNIQLRLWVKYTAIISGARSLIYDHLLRYTILRKIYTGQLSPTQRTG